MKRAWLILLPFPLALLALWLITRKRRVLAADGRTFVQIRAAGAPDANGVAAASIWRPDPPDGNDYTPDLAWELGQTDAPPMFRRFV